MTLLPLYAIGGMGAGDVKLMVGVGAWIGPTLTTWAFLSSAMMGGLMGLAMMIYSKELFHHLALMHTIYREVLTVRDPSAISRSPRRASRRCSYSRTGSRSLSGRSPISHGPASSSDAAIGSPLCKRLAHEPA